MQPSARYTLCLATTFKGFTVSGNFQNKPKKQRRGRRPNAKPLSDRAWYSLFRYWARTERLRDMTLKLIMLLKRKYGENFMDSYHKKLAVTDAIMFYDMEMFFEYWHSTLQTVVEAYEKNSLFDEKVEALLDMPIRDKLKNFRDHSFHFRHEFHDQDSFSLFNTEGAPEWIESLQLAMHTYLYSESMKLDQRLGRKPKTFEELMKEASMLPERTLRERYRRPVMQRNSLCSCGSGLRYKHCHGNVRTQLGSRDKVLRTT